jgi:L-asparaginase II
MIDVNPILIEVTRGSHVESRHRAAAVVVSASGRRFGSWGDVEASVFPRSAIKPLQALPMIESGAADRFAVSDAETALACGSHSGEPHHVDRVAAWLRRIGLSPEILVCGPHQPLSLKAMLDLVRSGAQPSRLHNNCSGKHAGFLTTALMFGQPPGQYADPDHPVQAQVRALLSQLSGEDVATAPRAVDGCGVPVYGLPLTGLALSFARLSAPDQLPANLGRAAERMLKAMVDHPHLVAGRDRFDTEMIARLGGKAVVKSGAEGVHGALLPGRGIGIAIKIDDGARRAADGVMAALLARFGNWSASEAAFLAGWAERPVLDTRGSPVGLIRPAAGWRP